MCDELTKELYEFLSQLDLNSSKCMLNHGYSYYENPDAVDYICQAFGDPYGSPNSIIRIPVCLECLMALDDLNYLLFFCCKCTVSQWIYKPNSKRKYNDKIKIQFLKFCPKCDDINRKEY